MSSLTRQCERRASSCHASPANARGEPLHALLHPPMREESLFMPCLTRQCERRASSCLASPANARGEPFHALLHPAYIVNQDNIFLYSDFY